jgi:hypothetical protein
MDDICIVWTRHDGGVSITWPVEEPRPGEDAAAYLARIAEQVVPRDCSYALLARSAVPADRTFRDAFTFDGQALAIDMPKAREIHRHRIRAARAPLLAALDVDYQRADERGDATAKARIATRKQQLRDAPAHPGIDSATSADELLQVWPLGDVP